MQAFFIPPNPRFLSLVSCPLTLTPCLPLSYFFPFLSRPSVILLLSPKIPSLWYRLYDNKVAICNLLRNTQRSIQTTTNWG
jgi:hypothetical protein